MSKKWNPQPVEMKHDRDKNGNIVTLVSTANLQDRKAYYAGYSDGFHNYPKGSGQEKPWPSEYERGYQEGLSA